MISSFDAGRGCPFLCSFCTIINVQGRKSRYRTADDIEAIVRSNQKNGVRYFFITDDNLARNRNWEAIFDRLIQLRQEGLNSRFVIQVDTACHKIPRFIEKAAAAGVKRVFIGLENIDPDNLIAAKKKQNHIADYRELLLEWRKHRLHHLLRLHHRLPRRHAGIGRAPHRDHQARAAARHSAVLLPDPPARLRGPRQGGRGGRRHRPRPQQVRPRARGLTDHPRMSRAEWQKLYHDAFRAYYTDDHMKTVIRRAAAGGARVDTVAFLLVTFWAASTLYNIYPLEAGLIRRKVRRDRRPTLPVENPLVFYPRYVWDLLSIHGQAAVKLAKIWWFMRGVLKDPNAKSYTDEALRMSDDYDHQEMYQLSDAARQAAREGEAHRGAQHAHADRRGAGGGGGVGIDSVKTVASTWFQ